MEPRGPCLDRVAASSSQDESAVYRSVIPTGLSYNSPESDLPQPQAGGHAEKFPDQRSSPSPPHEPQGPLQVRSSNIPPPPPVPPWRRGDGCVPPPGCKPELRRIVEIGAINLWRLIGLDAIRPVRRVP